MKTLHFPFLALGMGLFLLLLVIRGSEPAADGETTLPLLTLLIVNEFAFFLTGTGAFIGSKTMLATGMKPLYAITTILCGLLCLQFLVLGFELWPL